jgi:hypothetical protein
LKGIFRLFKFGLIRESLKNSRIRIGRSFAVPS